MLPARGAKKALIKPLPAELFIKSARKKNSSCDKSINNSFNGFDNHTFTSANKSLSRVPISHDKQDQPTDSADDYNIDESDDDDVFQNDTTDKRRKLNSSVQRISTPTAKLSNLLKASPLNFVHKRKRKSLVTPSTSENSFSNSFRVDVGIDESSPVKKAKCAQFADQSTILINRWKRLDKKSPYQKRETSNLTNSTLVDQMKALIEKERTVRTVWRHSMTSQLKNKFKETIKGKETLTLKLSHFVCQFHVGFAEGEIIESTIKQNYEPGDIVHLIFPSILCENMGFSNGTIVQFVSPWSVINIRNKKFIVNPFWITVIERCAVKDKKESDEKEQTLITWTCQCQEGFSINSLECNRAYSQSVN